MTDEVSEQNDANSDDGVVFANTNLPALGWFVNMLSMMARLTCDLCINSSRATRFSRDFWREQGEAATFSSAYRRFIPVPRHGGVHCSRRSCITDEGWQVVYDDPENPLTNNKGKMRVRKNGNYGYMVQWNIVPLRKNKRNTRFGVFVADMLKDNLDSKCTDSPYRVRVQGENYRVYSWMASSAR